ncbi:Cell division protein FtsZ/Cell division GTPase [Bibersteinia trehalosi USDA-ARS-USMARC-188]|uniref:Cell division protein FtsZ n=4 Tax=Bibersteinia trehalosi TaxID=47735 RepID=A0A4V7IB84_BIBTR|nr:cell division protein FtsZ [Bibersteinia trehalosi]AGH37840.1 Cell division protein FtsZ/Cell division GTPase [Bibersteinia trehalosi USDA-ARS-USMARC-192]AHG82360.1 Cell division protein FtsZ/Cell division GTPase [Bibersteinia trehalosi USDA-ARS-USMARC-188]AHG84676.1 Cell division protein FtsZ/Cell division GTPase [Bibersteinia trehalosi USDA-ARS-USMARC-189]OAQ15627.1 peptidase M23 [Bibersteinia trehalosi Y31]RRN00483.1 cell division protein FtsZ [Bibersteinia trehalosi]
MFEPIFDDFSNNGAVIKVIGVGGGGGNALNHMVLSADTESMSENDMGSVEFFSVNTDAQVLRSSAVRNTIQIGASLTKGLGAGGNPQVGYEAAEEDRDALSNMIEGADMVFIAAGMGGGSGTGAAPVIAEIAKSKDILTVAVVTKPFKGEGRKRLAYAEQGIRELSKHVDTLIIIQNEKLAKILPKNVKLNEAFAYANNVLRNSVLGITEMITKQGVVNVDFADVTTVMSQMGRALMGTAEAEGEGRAERVIQEAVSSPLLEDVDLSGAKGILVNIVSDGDIELAEYNTILDYVESFADPDAAIIVGTAEDPDLAGRLRVTIVATGIGQPEETVPQKVTPMLGRDPHTQPQAVPQPHGYQNNDPMAAHRYGQPNQFGNTHQAVNTNTPTSVDRGSLFSPASMPDFMRNRNNG